MHFEGSESFADSADRLRDYLGDAGRLARAMPDHVMTLSGRDRAEWDVRPKFAFMAGSLHTIAEIALRTPDDIRYRIASVGVGSSSTMDVRLSIVAKDDGTLVRWTGDMVELGGILKLVPRGMLQVAALKVIADVWIAVRRTLHEEDATSGAKPG